MCAAGTGTLFGSNEAEKTLVGWERIEAEREREEEEEGWRLLAWMMW